MRLLRLLAWGLLGYVIYELYQGMVEPRPMGSARTGGQRSARSRDLHRALNEDAGRMNITGIGRGASVTTEDIDGGRSRHVVGRGVVMK